jgi:hypothetical protein
VTGILVQQAKVALGRSEDPLKLALGSCPGRAKEEVEKLYNNLNQHFPRDMRIVRCPAKGFHHDVDNVKSCQANVSGESGLWQSEQ